MEEYVNKKLDEYKPVLIPLFRSSFQIRIMNGFMNNMKQLSFNPFSQVFVSNSYEMVEKAQKAGFEF